MRWIRDGSNKLVGVVDDDELRAPPGVSLRDDPCGPRPADRRYLGAPRVEGERLMARRWIVDSLTGKIRGVVDHDAAKPPPGVRYDSIPASRDPRVGDTWIGGVIGRRAGLTTSETRAAHRRHLAKLVLRNHVSVPQMGCYSVCWDVCKHSRSAENLGSRGAHFKTHTGYRDLQQFDQRHAANDHRIRVRKGRRRAVQHAEYFELVGGGQPVLWSGR